MFNLGRRKLAHLKNHVWVWLKDNRAAVIDHIKTDGKCGVRPVDLKTGKFYPNLNTNWSIEDRMKYPEEYALTRSQFVPFTDIELKHYIY